MHELAMSLVKEFPFAKSTEGNGYVRIEFFVIILAIVLIYIVFE